MVKTGIKKIVAVLSLFAALCLYAGTTEDSTQAWLKALQTDPENMEALNGLYSLSMRIGEYRNAMDYAERMLQVSEKNHDTLSEMLAHSYMGQSYLALDKYDSAYVCLTRALEFYSDADTAMHTDEANEAIFTIYNGLGIYAVTIERDYKEAISYFLRGLSLAEELSDYYDYAIFGANLVVSYNLLRDTSGLKYALDIYDYGKRAGDIYIQYAGSYVTAMMYYLKGNLENAKYYLNETMRLPEGFFDKMEVYSLYGDILYSEGDIHGAEKYYREALQNIDEVSSTTAISVYKSYGEFLLGQKRYREAISMLDKGISLAEAKGNRVYTYQLYDLQSEAYAKSGDYRKALEQYRKFYEESADINMLEQERAINSLTRKYENERHQKEIQEHELTIMKKNREIQLTASVCAVIIIGLVALWIVYRHKNRLYTRIARQYKEAISKEKSLENRIRQLQDIAGPVPQGEKYSNSSLTEDKSNEMFMRIERLMAGDRIYRENGLTRDKVAERLGSNRTYISQVINDRTGMSFLAYINSYRIEEAIELLSDPANDIPLKALSSDLGFSSISTFYKLFSEKVGMPPAKYREKIIEISKSGN